jgi:hypothetical protein
VKDTTSGSRSGPKAASSAAVAASVASPLPQADRASRQPTSTAGRNGASNAGTPSPVKPMRAPSCSSAHNPKPVRLEAGLDAVDEGVALRPVQRGREVRHDLRVGVERRERRAVAVAPAPQQQPLGAELVDHDRFAAAFTDCL